MENHKQIQNLIPDQMQASENYKPEWESVELSDEEMQAIIKAAKISKLANMKLRAHAEKVNAPIEVPNISSKQLETLVYNFALKNEPHFVIDSDNRKIFKLLCQYFTLDPSFEKTEEMFSLKKGIMLVGPVGCGKTTLLSLFRKNTVNSFSILKCRDIAGEYTHSKDGGNDVLQHYSQLFSVPIGQYFDQKHIGAFFDDLGTENIKKHFGNEVNVMQEIILNRYDSGLRNKTHFTTNLNAEQIDDYYGTRVRSRLREMCNVISFNENSSDRRR